MNGLKLALAQSFKYKGGINQWAWVLHRLSGLGLVLFLPVLAVMILGAAAGYFAPATYGATFAPFSSGPLFNIIMIVVTLCTVYHVFNGARVGTLDIMPGMRMRGLADAAGIRPKTAAPFGRSEAWWWMYVRLTGVAMLVLVTVSMFGVFGAEGGIQTRWAWIGWRVYDVFVLAVVYTHGLRGLMQVLQDYIHSSAGLKAAAWATVLAGGLVFVICAAVILLLPWKV